MATPTDALAAYRSGKTVAEIATALGIPRSSAHRRLVGAGVSFRRTGPPLAPLSIHVPTDPGLLGYVAGLFDGEGNLYWRRRTGRANSVRITIYSTTGQVMDWLVDRIGGTVRWDRLRQSRRGWKPIARWELNRNRDGVAFLTALMPYLIIKRDAAAAVLADLSRAEKR